MAWLGLAWLGLAREINPPFRYAKGTNRCELFRRENRTKIDLGSLLGTPWATKAEKGTPECFRNFGGAPGAQNGPKKEAGFT